MHRNRAKAAPATSEQDACAPPAAYAPALPRRAAAVAADEATKRSLSGKPATTTAAAAAPTGTADKRQPKGKRKQEATAASTPAAAAAASSSAPSKRRRAGKDAVPAASESAAALSSSDSDEPDVAALARQRSKNKSVAQRRAVRALKEVRPFYSSEEDEDEREAAARAAADPKKLHKPTADGGESTDAEEEDKHMPPLSSPPRPLTMSSEVAAAAVAAGAAAAAAKSGASAAAAAAAPSASATASSSSLHRLPQPRLPGDQSVRPHNSLTLRLLKRMTTSAPAIKQWPLALAKRTGAVVDRSAKQRKGWAYELELDAEGNPQPALAPAAATAAGAAGAGGSASVAVTKRSMASAHFSRPFDILPREASMAADGSDSPSDAAAAAAASAADPSSKGRYWSFLSGGITKRKGDPGYTVTCHDGYTDSLDIRASPPLTAEELAALVPVSAEDACRENGLTLLRHQRVKLANHVKAKVQRAMRAVTGELDRKVLSMCENGTVSKCRLYRTDDYNVTLLSTEKILSGEPIGCWMGTLRSRRTFAQRVGMESSLAHIWAYETPVADLGPGYLDDEEGPAVDLVHDGVAYGNETHFLRDPKWSHQRADANITSRLVWSQKLGYPYIAFVALCDIEPYAELFIDWGEKCWRNVWRTQLTALAANSHRQHVYLKALQTAAIHAGLDPLPQHCPRFGVHPLPDTEESEEQRIFLDEQTSPYSTTSAVTLGQVARELNAEEKEGAAAAKMEEDAPVAAAAASSSSAAAAASPSAPATRPETGVSFDHSRADAAAASTAAAAAAASSDSDGSADGSTCSSPYTPSFNTHKAFVASVSHTMQTVFASALLRENTKEIARIQRRLEAYRLNHYRRLPRQRKPLLEGAMHVAGQHTFELLRDPRVAFVKSGTRLGREAKVDVSDETKKMIKEAFDILRPLDFPDRRDQKLIRDGNVPKAAIYEVVGLKHPARFFTRPDQAAFALVTTAPKGYSRGEPIGAYIGVFRDFAQFHKASNKHAMKQVYAYDCLAPQIPGPPNPHLNEAQRAAPLKDQLAYRGGDLVVESLYWGNEVRFMNDCYGRRDSDATINAHATIAWDPERHWPIILVRASYPIRRGEEIIVDYGDEFWNKVARSLMMDHAAYGDEVRHLIAESEEWLRRNGVALPERSDIIPQLFTHDREKDVVIYPRGFLAEPAAKTEEGRPGSEGTRTEAEGTAAEGDEQKEAEDPARKRQRLAQLQQGLSSLETVAGSAQSAASQSCKSECAPAAAVKVEQPPVPPPAHASRADLSEGEEIDDDEETKQDTHAAAAAASSAAAAGVAAAPQPAESHARKRKSRK